MKILIAILVLFAAMIVLVGAYLSPNDLKQCNAKPTGSNGCVKADAIVAISGGDTKSRTSEAIKLYKHGWADTLIFSGAAQDKTGPSNAEAMQKQALEEGVPKEAIILEETGETTRQNAEATEDLLIKNDFETVILVTSSYHQRRAALEFKERTKGMVKIVNHPVANDNQWSQLWWLTPIGWWLAIGELFKITAFYLGSTR